MWVRSQHACGRVDVCAPVAPAIHPAVKLDRADFIDPGRDVGPVVAFHRNSDRLGIHLVCGGYSPRAQVTLQSRKTGAAELVPPVGCSRLNTLPIPH